MQVWPLCSITLGLFLSQTQDQTLHCNFFIAHRLLVTVIILLFSQLDVFVDLARLLARHLGQALLICGRRRFGLQLKLFLFLGAHLLLAVIKDYQADHADDHGEHTHSHHCVVVPAL